MSAATIAEAGPQTDADVRRRLRAERSRAFAKAVGRALLNTLVTLVVVLALWQAVVSLTGVSHYVAKGPVDVWRYLVVGNPARAGQTAAAHRDVLAPLLGRTLQDSAIGFVTGMVVAVVLALLFTLSKTVEAGVMPLALLLRTVPLVSIAPVIILITGRGTPASVAVIGSIVVLFPALA